MGIALPQKQGVPFVQSDLKQAFQPFGQCGRAKDRFPHSLTILGQRCRHVISAKQTQFPFRTR
jgi:hypothetical protein